MRGIILAGGTGSRLGPLTKVVNKHLLPVGGRPMIHWPIKILRDNTIDDITIVSTPRGVGQLAESLGGGFTYRVQDKPGGIVQAIGCADRYAGRESICVILGDNVFLPSPVIPKIFDHDLYIDYAHCYLSEVLGSKIKEFGVPKFDKETGIIKSIEEKPENPSSAFAVTGMYLFTANVFDKIKNIPVSKRGETEITDLLNEYTNGRLSYDIIKSFWGDAGTLDGMQTCTEAIYKYMGA